MYKNLVTLYYAPLRPYVNRYLRKLGKFCKDVLPDVLVILVSVWLMMQLWEFCFWH